MTRSALRTAAALVVACGACKSQPMTVDSAAPPPAVTATTDAASEVVDAAEELTPDEVLERSMKMLEEVATIVQANAADCDAMATRLEEYYRAHADAIRMGHQTFDRLSDDARARVQAKYRERYHAAWRRLQPGAKKCQSSERIRNVTDRLFGWRPLPAAPALSASGEP